MNAKKILIIDDDSMSVEFMSIFLESEGYQTIHAYSYEEACTQYNENQPDIIITDIELTDGNGVDFAKFVKQTDKPFIIGISGHNALAIQELGKDISVFDKLLTKPIELEQLKNSLPT